MAPPEIIVLALAAWIAVNLFYRICLWLRWQRRERHVRRDDQGVVADGVPFTCGEGDTALLLVHGFADTPAVFREMALQLAAHGLSCRALRLPGAGQSPETAALQTLDSWLDAIRAEAAALHRTHHRVWLAGHSMGAALALLAQLDDPMLADGLVLLTPMFKVSSARAPLLAPRTWFRVFLVMFPLARLLESNFPPNTLTAGGADTTYQRDRFIPIATYKNLFQLTDRLRDRGSEVRCPLLVTLVEGDRIVDTPAARAWLGDCHNAPALQITTLDGCGHALPLETGKLPRICRDIASFISNHQ